MIELLHTDCMIYMKTLKDKAFDLAIVDPPYREDTDNLQRINNMNGSVKSIMKGRMAVNKVYDYKPIENNVPDENYFYELRRVSKNQLVWGYNYFADILGPCRGPIVWNKETTGYLADGELCYCSIDKTLQIFTHLWNGMLQKNMKEKEERQHPTQKPVALYRWLLHNYAQPGQRILDTHLGSGSSAIAAHQMGFDFVGTEIDKSYYDAACKRFKEQTAQQSLFQ